MKTYLNIFTRALYFRLSCHQVKLKYFPNVIRPSNLDICWRCVLTAATKSLSEKKQHKERNLRQISDSPAIRHQINCRTDMIMLIFRTNVADYK